MSASNTKPTVVLVPGFASVGRVVFEPTVAALRTLGWSDDAVVTVNNPTVDPIATKADLSPHGLAADIRNLRGILTKLIEDEGRDVLLVGHSYGGTPSMSASQDLWKHLREPQGKKGGVVQIGLIASSLTLPGRSVAVDRSEWQQANDMPPDDGSGVEMIDGVSHMAITQHSANVRD
jgi:pimeloyl-ACP methyl ester carboxylesterase